MIDEKDFAPFADGEMRGFSRAGRERLDRARQMLISIPLQSYSRDSRQMAGPST